MEPPQGHGCAAGGIGPPAGSHCHCRPGIKGAGPGHGFHQKKSAAQPGLSLWDRLDGAGHVCPQPYRAIHQHTHRAFDGMHHISHTKEKEKTVKKHKKRNTFASKVPLYSLFVCSKSFFTT